MEIEGISYEIFIYVDEELVTLEAAEPMDPA